MLTNIANLVDFLYKIKFKCYKKKFFNKSNKNQIYLLNLFGKYYLR